MHYYYCQENKNICSKIKSKLSEKAEETNFMCHQSIILHIKVSLSQYKNIISKDNYVKLFTLLRKAITKLNILMKICVEKERKSIKLN